MRTALLLLLLVAGSSTAQTIAFDQGYALVFPKQGPGFSVRNLQISGDSIYCLSPEIRAYAKSDILKILVRHDKPSSNSVGIGALIGAYAMHYAVGRASNQTGAFLSYSSYGASDNSALIWTTLLGLGLGGGVGYLVNTTPSYSNLTPYVFVGSKEVVDEQWRLFIDKAADFTNLPKIHVTLSGGNVSTPTGTGYRRMLEAHGFTRFDETYYGNDLSFFSNTDNDVQRATNFNWLRKAEIEYSITENIRAGITFSWLSEPALYARKGLDEPFGSSNTEIYEFLQKLEGHGYYATGAYHYYLTPKKNFDINGRLGVGMASMHHEIKGEYRRNSSDSPTEAVISDDKNYFSFFGSVGANFGLYPSLTLGLTANYFYGGKTTMSDIFIIDIPPMDVTYSTVDVGFSLGVHF